MTFVPSSSLAVVGTVTVTDALAESYLATIATNTTGVASEATLKRAERAMDDVALATFAPEMEDADYRNLLEALITNTATLSSALATLTTNTAQLATAQPVTVASLPLPAGAATEATLKRVERAADDLALAVIAPEVLEEGA